MRPKQSKSSLFHFCAALAAGISVFVISPAKTTARDTSGAVYVMTNATSNSVMVFHRNDGGTLTSAGSFLTHGAGFGSGVDPLGSQGSLTLTSDHRLLFAVNAGSNDISIFGVKGDQLLFFRIGKFPANPLLDFIIEIGIIGFADHPFRNQLFLPFF